MKTRITSLEGNRQKLDGGAMFGNAPRALWSRWIEPDQLGRIPLACRSMLAKHKGQRILFETGVGCFFDPKLADRYGVQEPERHLLREDLKKQGLKEDDIDLVVLSHLHFDHAGGLLPSFKEMQSPEWELLFPKAKYVVGEEALERAQKPHFRDRASFIPELTKKLLSSGRLIVIKDDGSPLVNAKKQSSELPDGLDFYFSSGHTPGQMLSCLKGEQNTVMFCGDLIPGTHWVHLSITMGYDRFPEKLIEEKETLYSTQADLSSWKFFYTHDPHYSISNIQKNKKGKYVPEEPQTSLVDFEI